LLAILVARHAANKMRPGGTLLFMGGTGARRPGIGLGIASTLTAAFPALTATLALELAPVRVNPAWTVSPKSIASRCAKKREQCQSAPPIARAWRKPHRRAGVDITPQTLG
jgi:hypothetical protein